MYIARFTYDNGLLLPIWSPEIVDGQNNLNLCSQRLTMSVVHNSTTYTQTENMIYESETTASPAGRAGLATDQQGYYYVYTYSHIVYLFNNMVTACYNGLADQVGGSFTAACPFLDYDSGSGLFSMYFDTEGETFTMSFDANLYAMFYGFYFRNNNQLVVNNNGLNSVTIGDKTFTKVTQDMVSTSSWSPIQSLVFTTNSMPIVSEQNTLPLNLTDTNLNSQSSVYQKFNKIITDISLPVDRSSDWRNFIPYAPTFPRYVNFSSSDPLRTLDITLSFQDKNSGHLIPCRIPNGGNISIKFCFERIKQ